MNILKDANNRPVRVSALCRGEGLGYVLLSSDEQLPLQAIVAVGDGVRVPCSLYPVASVSLREQLVPGSAFAWVLVLPLLSGDCVISITSKGRELTSLVFPALRSKVSSRFLALTKPQVAESLRGYERLHGAGRVQVRIHKVWHASEDELVWRVRVAYPVSSKEAIPQLRVFNAAACDVGAQVTLMEDQIVPSGRDASRLVRFVTFSCLLPKACTSFYVVARLKGEDTLMGFDGMNAPRAAWLAAESRRITSGAAGSGVYKHWFELHRVSDAELALQLSAYDAMPEGERTLMSIVVPLTQSSQGPVAETIASAMSQTYGNWELVLTAVGDAGNSIGDALSSYGDTRIRVEHAQDKIAGGCIAVATRKTRGDYVVFLEPGVMLEPDALWHLVMTMKQNPSADLAYSDSDHMNTDGAIEPVFRAFPNYGKLYEYNYLGQMLVLSRRALSRMGLCDEGALGAQGYDITLRGFEVSREIIHVPHVLYHVVQRQEDSSGAADEQAKHEAGKHALTAHLSRRWIDASVEDGELPCTYRVRYALPTPKPMISIIIPTRDQCDLLRACVGSILQKTTYDSYEIVLVENNSQEAHTFELYEELCARDARIQLVTWTPPERGMFNYSAIVNYGVARSHGEIVVLLNNDTEVIEPHWLEEMAGCLMRPEVGVVGAKLLFEDGLIQHVGMTANPDGDFCHVCQNLGKDALGPGYAAAMPGDYSMVTGACQMVRRELFEKLGGYDEELTVGFNDGDFCLRAREQGFATTVCAHALLHHREFSTRGRESTDARMRSRYLIERSIMLRKHAEFFAKGDPAVNPNLDPRGLYFDFRPSEQGDDTCF